MPGKLWNPTDAGCSVSTPAALAGFGEGRVPKGKSIYVSVGEAADLLGLTPQTVRRLCNSGDLACQRKTGLAKSHRRLLRSEVERYRKQLQG